MRRRDATLVVYEILVLLRSGLSKTQVMYRANLSFRLCEEYITFLLERGHVRLKIDGRGVQRYILTEKGTSFAKLLSEVEKEMEGFLPIIHRSALTFSRPSLQEITRS